MTYEWVAAVTLGLTLHENPQNTLQALDVRYLCVEPAPANFGVCI